MVSAQRFTDEEREDKLNQIVQEHGNAILRHCLLLLHDASSAEDAAQDSLIKIYRKMNSYREEGSEKAWIMRIVTNTCRDYYRTAWMRHIDQQSSLDELLQSQAFYDSEQQTNAKNQEVMKAVMSLKKPLQEVILLRYYQEMKISEIAHVLHLSEAGVKKRLRNALDRLRPELREVFFDE